jgi:hypothetical protein
VTKGAPAKAKAAKKAAPATCRTIRAAAGSPGTSSHRNTKSDFRKYSTRLEIEGISFKSLIPRLYFPLFLKESLGYRTHAKVSLPVLNPRTILNTGFGRLRHKPTSLDCDLNRVRRAARGGELYVDIPLAGQ